MKYFLLAVLGYCLPGLVVGQRSLLKIDYVFEARTKSGQHFSFNKVLLDDGVHSLFMNAPNSTSDDKYVIKPSAKDKGLFFDKLSDSVYYLFPIFQKDFHVVDAGVLDLMKWSLDKSAPSKQVLGYNCKVAKVNFRGRNYTAFYTDSIPFTSGPFKFSGLPGVILEVFSDDNKFHFTATGLKITSSSTLLKNPYAELKGKEEFISFKEHKDLYRKKLTELQKMMQSKEKDEDVAFQVEDESIELTY